MPRRKKRRGREQLEPAAAGEEPWAPYCRFPHSMSGQNRVELLVDGAQAFPAMLEAIAGARRTVLMDSYIFNADRAGRLFADALAERAGAGVQVYLIVDGMGTISVPADFFEGLERAGVHVLEYRPVAPWRRGWGLLRRDHRKLLVVDGRVGFTGGLNVGDEWFPPAAGGHGWHDIHVRIEGPAVRELAKLARSTWSEHGQVDLDPRLFLPEIEGDGSTTARIIGSRERKNRQAIRRSYLHAIKNARHTILIANAYFLPGIGFRRALRNAVRRGVDVRVMVPARGDILPVQLASQALYSRLLKAGIRLFLWREAVLHAKTAVVDGQWATVGSFNIDHRSWAMNLEVNVNVLGERFAGELAEVFRADQERCEELTLERWRQRPYLQRLIERFCLLFEKWM
jgi:cardiolipin synthase